MAFVLRRHPLRDLTIGRLGGVFDPEEIRRETLRALQAGDHAAGWDRFLLIEPDLDPERIAVSDLHDVKDLVNRIESTLSAADRYKAVIYPSNGLSAAAARLYVAMWQAETGARQEFHLVRSFAEAETILGICGLKTLIP